MHCIRNTGCMFITCMSLLNVNCLPSYSESQLKTVFNYVYLFCVMTYLLMLFGTCVLVLIGLTFHAG